MVIVETIALSTMVCNDLVMPVLLRTRATRSRSAARPDRPAARHPARRRSSRVVLLGYLYFRLAGEAYALVAIGLISFAAVAQFAPAMIGGHVLEGRRRAPARSPACCAGFAVWLYTLLLPSFAKSGWLPACFVERRAVRHRAAQALALFGLAGLNDITHAMLWSMLANVGAYVVVSRGRRARRSPSRRRPRASSTSSGTRPASGHARVEGHGVGAGSRARCSRGSSAAERAQAALAGVRAAGAASGRRASCRPTPALVQFVETALAGAIGGASARIMVASAVKEDALSDGRGDGDARRGLAGDRLQPRARAEVARARRPPRPSCARPMRGCRSSTGMKDDFVSTVTHELRTPLTSIRAFSEILHDNPALDADERQRFLAIIIQESERLTRLINQVLDLAKLESGRAEWQVERASTCRRWSRMRSPPPASSSPPRASRSTFGAGRRAAGARRSRPAGAGAASTCCPTRRSSARPAPAAWRSTSTGDGARRRACA